MVEIRNSKLPKDAFAKCQQVRCAKRDCLIVCGLRSWQGSDHVAESATLKSPASFYLEKVCLDPFI